MAGSSFLRARSPVMPKTTSAHGAGTRGSRRSRGSLSGLVITGPSVTPRPLLLVLELGPDRLRQLVPGVDELLHALVLQDLEDVVEVHAGVGDGLHVLRGLVVGLLDRRAGDPVVGVGHEG